MSEVAVEEVELGEFFKILAAQKKMTFTELALASGRTQSRLSNISRAGEVNTKILRQVLEGVEESLIVTLKNGHKYKVIGK